MLCTCLLSHKSRHWPVGWSFLERWQLLLIAMKADKLWSWSSLMLTWPSEVGLNSIVLEGEVLVVTEFDLRPNSQKVFAQDSQEWFLVKRSEDLDCGLLRVSLMLGKNGIIVRNHSWKHKKLGFVTSHSFVSPSFISHKERKERKRKEGRMEARKKSLNILTD